MIDLTLRIATRDRWLAVAANRGILDADGNPNPGFAVDEIGPVSLPPVLDVDGVTEIWPAFNDTWHWVHLRLYNDQAAADTDDLFPGEIEDGFRFTKSKLARWVRQQATQKTFSFRGNSIRVYEFGAGGNRVQLIDPRDAVIRFYR